MRFIKDRFIRKYKVVGKKKKKKGNSYFKKHSCETSEH